MTMSAARVMPSATATVLSAFMAYLLRVRSDDWIGSLGCPAWGLSPGGGGWGPACDQVLDVVAGELRELVVGAGLAASCSRRRTNAPSCSKKKTSRGFWSSM